MYKPLSAGFPTQINTVNYDIEFKPFFEFIATAPQYFSNEQHVSFLPTQKTSYPLICIYVMRFED